MRSNETITTHYVPESYVVMETPKYVIRSDETVVIRSNEVVMNAI
jgi:hypothetical protein